MLLYDWARKHGVSHHAVLELQQVFGLDQPATQIGMAESAVQIRVRLEASKVGARLWRNNVGVLQDERGVPLRYGLCNESKAMNSSIKSSDLIGIRPLIVTQAMVGMTHGIFTAREVKKQGWTFKGTPREQAQLKFLEIVNALGGDGKFTTGEY